MVVVLGVAQKDLDLPKVFRNGPGLVGRLRPLQPESEHSTEFMGEIPEKTSLAFAHVVGPCVPADSLNRHALPKDVRFHRHRKNALGHAPLFSFARQVSDIVDPRWVAHELAINQHHRCDHLRVVPLDCDGSPWSRDTDATEHDTNPGPTDNVPKTVTAEAVPQSFRDAHTFFEVRVPHDIEQERSHGLCLQDRSGE